MINEMMNSQPKVSLSKVLLMLCLSAAIVMGSMPCKPFVMEVKADTPADKTITGLGVGEIIHPTPPSGSSVSWKGDYVFFGKYDGNAMKYRALSILDYRTNGNNYLLLDCDNVLTNTKFDGDSNIWAGDEGNGFIESDIHNWLLEGNQFYKKDGVFSDAEKYAINGDNTRFEGDWTLGGGYPDGTYKYNDLTAEDPVFLLDARSVIEDDLGYSENPDASASRIKKDLNGAPAKWWLRTKSTVSKDGYPCVFSVEPDGSLSKNSVNDASVGVSPALTVNLARVLFSSEVEDETYKLTLASVGLGEPVCMPCTRDGNKVTISYSVSYDPDYKPTQLSVVVTKNYKWDSSSGWIKESEDAKLLQYAKLDTGDSFKDVGTGTFNLDPEIEGEWGKDYNVYILAEKVNGAKETDYASTPVEIKQLEVSVLRNEYTYDGYENGLILSAIDADYLEEEYLYGETPDSCSLNSLGITNVSESPKTIYYIVNAKNRLSAKGSATVTIKKADPVITAPSAKTDLKFTGQAQALVNAGTVTGGTLYYAVTTENTAPAGTAYTAAVPKKTDAGTYYVWYKVTGDGNHKDVAPDSVSVTIKQAESAITKAPSAISGLKFTGQAQALVNEGTVTGGTIYYAVTTENTAPAGSAYTAAVPQKTGAGTYYVWYKVNGGGNYEDIAPDSVSVTIKQAESAITKAPSAISDLKYTGEEQALVNAGTATGGKLYYAVTTGTAAPAGSAYTAAVPQKTDAGTYYVWYKVTGYENYADIDPDSVSVTIKQAESAITKAPSAISGLKYTGEEQALVNAGTATGGRLYYAVTTENTAPVETAYTEAVPGKTDAGTYYVWYKVNGGGNYEDVAPDSVSVTINKADPVITKAPSEISGLKYTGEAQALIGKGTVTGGTMYYAVTTENTAPDGSAYTEAVPEKTDAGTYYVWYKAVGDKNHKDSTAASLPVTIEGEEEPERKAERPVLIKATSDAISVKTEDGMEYSVDGGNNWNTTGIFKDLQQDTEYSIIARYAASGEKAAGEPSEALRVRTLKIVEKPVSTKILKVSDNEISIDTVLLSEEGNNEGAYSVGQVEIPDDVAVSLFNSLSEEEQQMVAEGEKFTISISVKESIIDMENKELKDKKEKADKEIKEKTGGTVEATGMMLDIGLLVQVGNSEKKKTEPTQGSGKITFTVTVPVEMKNTDSSITRTYYLIHILDDGTVEIVNSGTEAEIPAETDSFSYWYLTYVDEKKEEEKKNDEGGSGNPSSEKVITVSDNQPMAYSEETKGDFRIGYCHEIPFFGKAKPDITLFGDIKVFYNGVAYKAVKIKVNKKKGLIQITGLDIADKDILKAVKKATKGSAGLPFKINPYYVKDTDTVTPKFKKDGSLKSVKIRINEKDYKAKKDEFSYDQATKTVVFDGENLKGSCRLP